MKSIIFQLNFLVLLFLGGGCNNSINEAEKNGEISGLITDASTGAPIQGVAIIFKPDITTCKSDKEGKFFLTDIKPESYLIIATHEKYETDSIKILVNAGSTANVNLKLKSHPPLIPITQSNLLKPENGFLNAPLKITLIWNKVKSVTGSEVFYSVYLDLNANPATLVSKIKEDTTITVSVPLKNTRYYWRVEASDYYSNKSISQTFYFTTNNDPVEKISYKCLPPHDKLPYPTHNPNFNQAQYDDMINKVFIINNFGQDQFSYLHDGLDFVAKNGTKIYSVDSGYVRLIQISNNPSYHTIIIEDKNKPNYGWGYTHVGNFQVQNGDFVQQGTQIAEISFAGTEHVHLDRIYCLPGYSLTNMNNTINIQPVDYFYFPDTKPPLIKSPFHYFENNSNNKFTNNGTTAVKGEVDIVVPIRECGEYAKGRDPNYMFGFGDRLAIKNITYEIMGPDNIIHSFKSFDFSRIQIIKKDNSSITQPTIYKKYQLIEGKDRVMMEWSDYYSYYIITNNQGKENNEPLRYSDANLSWNTTEKNSDGTFKYPNGEYKITVKIYDFYGHSTTASDQVVVNN